MLVAAEAYLREHFDLEGQADPKAGWIENTAFPWIYLNQELIAARRLRAAEVEKALAEFLLNQDGIYRVFTRADLAAEYPVNDPIGRRMKRSYYADRCGDVGIVIAPYCLMDNFLTGTNHGTPHSYDTHVPLLVIGPDVKRGVFKEEVAPLAIAAILARSAGIKTPTKATYPVPDGLFESAK
jgi:hypothetical protein